jgi:hypothetical protein
MAKQTGLGDYVAVDDSGGTARDISNDISGGYGINISQELLDTTGLDKSARERLTGMSDSDVTLTGTFNAASNKSHDVFKTRTTARTFDLRVGGNTSTNPKLAMEMMIASYNISRDSSGALTWTAGLNLSNGTVPAWSTVA